MSWTAADIPDQSGRVAVVTGANGGLGMETARELARRNAHVVMAARNLDKAAVAEADIRRSVPTARLEVRQLDLASTASIEAFADAVLATHDAIHLLFNNAGVMATPEWQTEDGFEMQFGTNHLGHFLLTFLLMRALLAAGDARVVTTTSTARFTAGDYDLDDAHHRDGEYDPWTAYGYSKRANLQFAVELDRRLQAAGAAVTALAADPGFANTELQSTAATNHPGQSRHLFFEKWVPRLGHSAASGALAQLRAGTDPSAEGGSLYRPRWIIRGAPVRGGISAKLRDPAELAKLWTVSEQDLGVDFDVPGIVAAAG